MFSKVLGLISKYGLHSGISVKMNFTLYLAYFMVRMSKCSFCTRYKNFLELFGGRFEKRRKNLLCFQNSD